MLPGFQSGMIATSLRLTFEPDGRIPTYKKDFAHPVNYVSWNHEPDDKLYILHLSPGVMLFN
jgi:hypothetical protein